MRELFSGNENIILSYLAATLGGSMLEANSLEDALMTLGEVLADRNSTVSLAVVGGGALLLMGYIVRSTKDIDVVAVIENGEMLTAEPLPPSLLEAVGDVAMALDLEPDWLNAGPTSLLRLGLPVGFLERCEHRSYRTMHLHIAGRQDQIALKPYAAADHWPARDNKHLEDLNRLSPSPEDLEWATQWVRSHDPSKGFEIMQLRPLLEVLEGTDG